MLRGDTKDSNIPKAYTSSNRNTTGSNQPGAIKPVGSPILDEEHILDLHPYARKYLPRSRTNKQLPKKKSGGLHDSGGNRHTHKMRSSNKTMDRLGRWEVTVGEEVEYVRDVNSGQTEKAIVMQVRQFLYAH
jgi:hypothetical protein